MVDLSMAMLVITRGYLQQQSPRFLRFPTEEGARNRSRRCKTGWRRVIFGIRICETVGSLGHSGASLSSFLPDLQASNLETAHIGEIKNKNKIKRQACHMVSDSLGICFELLMFFADGILFARVNKQVTLPTPSPSSHIINIQIRTWQTYTNLATLPGPLGSGAKNNPFG